VKVPVFRRTKPDQPPATTGEPETEGRKGRPTPTRKEAESAARARAKTPLDKKAAGKMSRDQRTSQSARIRQGIKEGDERYLPARDKGPVRRFVRDYVDARLCAAELTLPLLFVSLVASGIGNQTLGSGILEATVLVIALDSVVMVVRLKRQVKKRFGGRSNVSTKGTTFYALSRSMQIRFLRLPKSQVKINQKLPDRY
jgi:hypothetical protein